MGNSSGLREGIAADGTYYIIKKNHDTGEWMVVAYVNGKRDEGKTYYTNDKQDAIDTLHHLIGATMGDSTVYGNKANFIDYLKHALIPDLKESGSEFYAQDFETGIAFMEDASLKKHNGHTRKDYINYLTYTIIPDTKEAGMTGTAEDLETVLKYLTTSRK